MWFSFTGDVKNTVCMASYIRLIKASIELSFHDHIPVGSAEGSAEA